jgi:hypothetical protein
VLDVQTRGQRRVIGRGNPLRRLRMSDVQMNIKN